MNKKLLIGTGLVFILLILMPSIPAIQQKTIEDITHDEQVEKVNNKFDDGKYRKVLDRIRHPILHTLVMLFIYLRWKKLEFLAPIAFDVGDWSITIKRPLLFLRCLWLVGTLEYWELFWNRVSDKYGWGWDIHLNPDWFD